VRLETEAQMNDNLVSLSTQNRKDPLVEILIQYLKMRQEKENETNFRLSMIQEAITKIPAEGNKKAIDENTALVRNLKLPE